LPAKEAKGWAEAIALLSMFLLLMLQEVIKVKNIASAIKLDFDFII
jgi:hypothetical protein